MNTILCPIDFSDNADNAVRYAARMAEIVNAELHLVHGLHVPVVDAYAPASTVTSIMEEVEQHAKNTMLRYAEGIERDFGRKVKTTVTFGLVNDIVEKIERDQKINLVVLGTHGATNAVDVLLGTTAAQIMAHSDSPTLVVPRDATFSGLKKVGYATDFSSDADKKIEEFIALMKPFNSEILVVNVTHESGNPDELDNIVKHLDHETHPILVKGDNIPDELNSFIRDNDLQALAMKRHKRNWFDNLFHKSMTKQMVYHSEVPIMVFN